MEEALKNKIIQFLLSMDLNTPAKREAIIIQASLDQRLVVQIDQMGAANQFVPLFLSNLVRYGKLEDGRDALEAVLRVIRERVGIEGQAICDTLVEDWRSYRTARGIPIGVEDINQHNLDYKYDVFFSCGRTSMFSEWINNIFFRLFEGFLNEYLSPQAAKIKRMTDPPGQNVLTYTKIALVHSRCLVATCFPSYFGHQYSKYEVAVMLQRERRLKYRTAINPSHLVVPVHVFDGDTFPDVLAQKEHWRDYNGFTSLGVEHSAKGVEFESRIIRLAAEVADVLHNAPPWDKKFFDDLVPDAAIINSLEVSPQLALVPRL